MAQPNKAKTGFVWHKRVLPRPIHDAGSASTPLELLFDLVFVVAIGSAVSQLSDGLADGKGWPALVSFALVFFAVWWAWMNFAWFASSYDVDDGPYRLAVMVQMAGVLVLAAGIDKAFDHFDWTAGTAGYVLMRLAMVYQWLRAARSDAARAKTARRYAAGIATLQVLWVLRLAVPNDLGWTVGSFALLAAAELAVPPWAERAERTAWHPHHIAERYALFTLILLGELVAVAVAATRTELDTSGLTPALAAVSCASLVLVFALWWLYFISPMAEKLAAHRELAFPWGYGHVACFLGLACLGSGLELAAKAVHQNNPHLSAVAIGYFVAASVALFLLCLWGIQAWSVRRTTGLTPVLITVLALMASPWLASTAFGIAGCLMLIALTVVALTFWITARLRNAGHPATDDPDQPAQAEFGDLASA
jgi:low temperature requirement protein LtrA